MAYGFLGVGSGRLDADSGGGSSADRRGQAAETETGVKGRERVMIKEYTQ